MHKIIECTKSELDLFSVPPTQTSIEQGVWDTIPPNANYEEGTLRFEISATNNSYINLSETELHLHIKLGKKDGNKFSHMDDSVKIGVVNNIMHSIFSQVEVDFNDKPVENTNDTYSYKAYLENLLSYDSEAKSTYLEREGFITDTSGEFENFALEKSIEKSYTFIKSAVGGIAQANQAVDIKTEFDTIKIQQPQAHNAGFIKRRAKFLGNGIWELIGRIHCDVFNINRYLLPNIKVSLTFTRQKPEFYLMGDSEDTKYKILIENASLKVRRCIVSDTVRLAHAKVMENVNARYPFKRVVVKPMPVPFGNIKSCITGISQGAIPSRVVVGFVQTTAYDGNFRMNPFNFRDFNLQSLQLKVASKALPYSSPLTFTYSKQQYQEAYNSLFQNIKQSGNQISYNDYANGNTLYAFDLSPDLCTGEHFNVLNTGSLDLEYVFQSIYKENDIPVSLTAIFYLEYDNVIEISKLNDIQFDYKP